MIGIGSTVYLRKDLNQFTPAWEPYEIIGETRVSWVIKYGGWKELKFPKKPDENGNYHQPGTAWV
jgi:hypothetical protein